MKIKYIMVGLLIGVVLQLIFNWNVNNPLLLILGWTQLTLFFVLNHLRNTINEK